MGYESGAVWVPFVAGILAGWLVPMIWRNMRPRLKAKKDEIKSKVDEYRG